MHPYICTVLLLGLVVNGCANGPQSAEKSAPDRSTYLSKAEHLDAMALLPPPPAPDSAAQRLDQARNQQYRQHTTEERWQQATLDARIRLPEAAGAFDCASRIALSEGAAPHTVSILRRVSIDTVMAVIPPKKKYRRQRLGSCGSRLGLGFGACRADSRQGRRNTTAWPSVRTQSRNLQRALAQRRRARTAASFSIGGQAAWQQCLSGRYGDSKTGNSGAAGGYRPRWRMRAIKNPPPRVFYKLSTLLVQPVAVPCVTIGAGSKLSPVR